MRISVLLVPIFLYFICVIKCFTIHKKPSLHKSFLINLSLKTKKQNTETDTRVRAKHKDRKREILQQLIDEHVGNKHVEKVEDTNREVRNNLDIDKEILQGKRIPRMRIKKTNNHIYASIIDDYKKHILCFTCSRDPNLASILGTYINKKTNRVINDGKSIKSAWEIGKIIGKKALNKGIYRVKFDRGIYKYKDKIEALAEGARAIGLIL
ncbi:apicoplast ribosomal protein L18 precursor, putative [Plasmodium berghei]|uniref:Apicoplast ribosomal protein L18, putative n=1 Tax=Plasmodium berghei TaxID=5821 RepID=A0A1C6Y824_PLABE|nr:apicoplast ribosomal protein L18 precursor, putative [Plasmodium berghei]SCN21705.1 apicoplast ribosomal protein L18 precursor, putative [Plasmodium berghei]SCO58932.1 apicoplast ribosomal protein L18 precursor, putative [Plasmodium berghei]SCO58984.1 apicoplast ribosomal protein L18 precursor, putative [Plasmodium berghei]